MPEVPPGSSPERPPQRRKTFLYVVALLATLCYSCMHWIWWPVKVVGDSMLPNYRDGDRHFVNKLAYWSAKPQRGDVIALQAPDGDVYIKRIIGLPGEHFSIRRGRPWINGRLLEEPYAESLVPLKEEHELSVTLGEDEYYVMGDNRATSVLGPIRAQRIIGKVAF